MSVIVPLTDLGTRKLRAAMPAYDAEARTLTSDIAMLMFVAWVNKGGRKPVYDAVSDVLKTAQIDGDDVWAAISAIEERAFIVGFQTAMKLVKDGAR